MSTQPDTPGQAQPDPFVQAEKRAKRWIWGCTGGCLGVIIAFGALVVIASRVLMHAVPVVPAGIFAVPQTSVFLAVRIEPDDPLMLSLPYNVTLEPRARRVLTAGGGRNLPFDRQQSQSIVLETAPLQMVIVLHAGLDERPFGGGVVLSIHRGSRPLRVVMKAYLDSLEDMGATLSTYKGARLATAEDIVAANRTNNFMWADNKDLVKLWINRLEERRALEADAEEPPGPAVPGFGAVLAGAYERLDAERPVLFVTSNAHGEIGLLLQLLCSKDEWLEVAASTGVASEDVLSVAAQMQSLNAVSAKIQGFIECADEDFAEGLAQRLSPVATQLDEQRSVDDLSVSREGSVVRVEAELLNAPEVLAAIPGQLLTAARRRNRQHLLNPDLRNPGAEPN